MSNDDRRPQGATEACATATCPALCVYAIAGECHLNPNGCALGRSEASRGDARETPASAHGSPLRGRQLSRLASPDELPDGADLAAVHSQLDAELTRQDERPVVLTEAARVALDASTPSTWDSGKGWR